MVRPEKEFDNIKIKLASPVRSYNGRIDDYQTGNLLEKFKSQKLLIIELLNQKWMVYFVNVFLDLVKV